MYVRPTHTHNSNNTFKHYPKFTSSHIHCISGGKLLFFIDSSKQFNHDFPFEVQILKCLHFKQTYYFCVGKDVQAIQYVHIMSKKSCPFFI